MYILHSRVYNQISYWIQTWMRHPGIKQVDWKFHRPLDFKCKWIIKISLIFKYWFKTYHQHPTPNLCVYIYHESTHFANSKQNPFVIFPQYQLYSKPISRYGKLQNLFQRKNIYQLWNGNVNSATIYITYMIIFYHYDGITNTIPIRPPFIVGIKRPIYGSWCHLPTAAVKIPLWPKWQ